MSERWRASGANRAAASAITSPDDVDRAGHRLLPQSRGGALVGGEEEGRAGVDLDPVALLRHRQIAAAQARFDVRHRQRARGAGTSQRRVGVAEDEDRVRPPLADRRTERLLEHGDVRGAEIERERGLGQAQLLEEDRRQRGVPVLARVDDALVDPGFAKRGRERRGLDELRPVADDGEDCHGRRLACRGVGVLTP